MNFRGKILVTITVKTDSYRSLESRTVLSKDRGSQMIYENCFCGKCPQLFISHILLYLPDKMYAPHQYYKYFWIFCIPLEQIQLLGHNFERNYIVGLPLRQIWNISSYKFVSFKIMYYCSKYKYFVVVVLRTTYLLHPDGQMRLCTRYIY